MKKVIATVAAFLLIGTLSMNAQQEPAKKDGTKKEHKEEHKGDKKAEHKDGSANKAENNGHKNTTTQASPKN